MTHVHGSHIEAESEEDNERKFCLEKEKFWNGTVELM